MKTINESFLDEDHKKLCELKEQYKKRHNLSKMNWHDFIIKAAENLK